VEAQLGAGGHERKLIWKARIEKSSLACGSFQASALV